MYIDRLLNQGSSPLLEQWLKFTDTRQNLLAEDVVNATTPGYIQKDLSVDAFQKQLTAKAAEMESAGPGSVNFDDVPLDSAKPNSLLFHDGNNRSMEQLMSDQAKNAMMHNVIVELLRKQFATMELALKDRPG